MTTGDSQADSRDSVAESIADSIADSVADSVAIHEDSRTLIRQIEDFSIFYQQNI